MRAAVDAIAPAPAPSASVIFPISFGDATVSLLTSIQGTLGRRLTYMNVLADHPIMLFSLSLLRLTKPKPLPLFYYRSPPLRQHSLCLTLIICSRSQSFDVVVVSEVRWLHCRTSRD